MSAHLLVSLVQLYGELGLIVALVFALLVGRIDRAATGAYGFRLLIIPGATLLWPVVLVRTTRALLALARGRS